MGGMKTFLCFGYKKWDTKPHRYYAHKGNMLQAWMPIAFGIWILLGYIPREDGD